MLRDVCPDCILLGFEQGQSLFAQRLIGRDAAKLLERLMDCTCSGGTAKLLLRRADSQSVPNEKRESKGLL